MTVRLPHVTDEHRASRLVDENYDRLKIEVIQTVESRLISEHNVGMARVDVEAGYNVAWHNIWKKVSKGEQVRKLTGFLVDTTYLRALDIYRTRHEGQHADADISLQTHHADVTDAVDDQLRLERLLASLQTSLTEREQKGILLCVVHGYSRQEAAEALEMKLSVFKRVMDSATRDRRAQRPPAKATSGTSASASRAHRHRASDAPANVCAQQLDRSRSGGFLARFFYVHTN